MFNSSDSYDLKVRTSSINLYNNGDSVNVADPRMFSYINHSFAGEETNKLKVTVNPSSTSLTNRQQVITEVQWKNLDVFVQDRKGPKQILSSVNGYVDNTKILAILGPSGAGKSTLLNTLAGINRNYSGEIEFRSRHKQLSFAYVPQMDELSDFLTVQECLLFASRMKNPAKTDHKQTVKHLIDQFGLQRCANQLTSKCSGGERKRLSIGCEMISNPDVLILDEPTSGLDSTTSLKVMQTLKETSDETAIIATIHQPNSILFQLFDLVNILTSGKCIYFGPPNLMVDHLKTLDVEVPTYTNPADFILDVANDDRSVIGVKLITKLSQNYLVDSDKLLQAQKKKVIERSAEESKEEKNESNNNDESGLNNEDIVASIELATRDARTNDQKCEHCVNCEESKLQCGIKNGFNGSLQWSVSPFNNSKSLNISMANPLLPVSRSKMRQMASFLRTYPLLVGKLFRCTLRDPQQSFFRLANNLLLPLILYILTTHEHGRESGCSFQHENSTHIKYETTYEQFDRQEIGIQNAGLTFLDLMFAFFSTLVPAVLAISAHINVLKKEYINSYYSVAAFYFALLTMIFLSTLFFATVNSLAYFFFTGQTFRPEKLFFFWFIITVTSLLGDIFGLGLSILFPKQSLTALVIGGFAGFGLHTFSGFFVPTDKMAGWFEQITWFVFCRHTFEGMLKAFYGHGQCAVNETMIFSFDQLLDFVDYYNHETHEGLQIIEKMPIKVRTALEEKPWDKEAIFNLAEAANDLDQDGLDRLDYFWKFKTSYIMDSYNIPHTSIWNNMYVPIITWFILVLLWYCVLRRKLNKSK